MEHGRRTEGCRVPPRASVQHEHGDRGQDDRIPHPVEQHMHGPHGRTPHPDPPVQVRLLYAFFQTHCVGRVTHTCHPIRFIRNCYDCIHIRFILNLFFPTLKLSIKFKISSHNQASIIQAPRCGTTVCRSHRCLESMYTFHCDGNYVMHPYSVRIHNYLVRMSYVHLANS